MESTLANRPNQRTIPDQTNLMVRSKTQIQSLRSRHDFIYQNYTLYRRKRAKEAIQQFRELENIQPALKGQISTAVRRAILVSSALHASANLFLVTTTLFIAVIYIVFYVYLLIRIVADTTSVVNALGAIALFIIFSFVGAFLHYYLNIFIFKKSTGRTVNHWNNFVSVLGGIFVLYVLFVAGIDTLNALTLAIFLMSLYSFLYLLLLTPLVYLVYGLWKIISRKLSKDYFDELTITSLLQLAFLVQTSEQVWSSFEFKRKRANELENIADGFEHDFHRVLVTKDFATNSWLAETGQKIAATFRLYKRSMLVPASTTKHDLQANLLTAFLYAAQGEWGSLVQSEPILIDRTQVLLFSKRLVRAFIVGAIPLVIFRGAVFLGLSLGGASDFLTVITLGWMVFAIIEVVDPNFSNRLSSFKELRNTLLS